MKTCVLITGTNAVGKTSLANALITHFGGISHFEGGVSFCEGNAAFAGKYCSERYGGVDSLNNTHSLAGLVQHALLSKDVVFCEGCRLHTFGLNLQKALFTAQRAIVVNLYADMRTIFNRLNERGKQEYDKHLIYTTQRCSMLSARKWRQIGVEVLQFNTGEISTHEIMQKTLELLQENRFRNHE